MLVAASSAVSVSAVGQTRESAVDIDTRPGVTLRFLLLAPREPVGSVILLAGGHGILDIARDGSLGWGKGNFLVRMRARFAEAGFVTAVPDTASDRKPPASLTDYRYSQAQAEDLAALVHHLRRIKGPVWLIGTSRGTISAANAAARADAEGADGLVLTSTMAAAIDAKQPSLEENVDLARIRVPTLIVQHASDACRYTRARDVPALVKRLKGAAKVEVLTFEGGRSDGDACEAYAYHGFAGIENDVVDAITAWLKANAP